MLKSEKKSSWVGIEVPRGSAVSLKTFLDFQVGELLRKLNLSLGETVMMKRILDEWEGDSVEGAEVERGGA